MLGIIEGLIARGVECRVVLPKPGPLVAELESRGAVCHIRNFNWWVGAQPLRGIKKLTRLLLRQQRTKGREIAGLLSSWNPNVVVTNTLCMAVGAFAAKRLCSAHVWRIGEFGLLDHGLHFLHGRRLSLWVINRYSDAVICNSQALVKHFSDAIPAGKMRMIRNRMKPRAEADEATCVAPRNRDSLNCLILGTAAPSKRQEDAVIAVGQLVRAGLDVHLSVVGGQKREYKKLLDRLVDESRLRHRVEFVNWVRDPTPYIHAADVLLMCSRMEAFGNVTVEAMQMGRPVIGARSGGTKELIRDGQTGLLFDVADPNDLARKIRHLYENRELVDKLGAAAGNVPTSVETLI